MIGCVMLMPLAAIFLAGTMVTSTLTIAIGAATSMITIATGMFVSSLIASAAAILAVWMFILS